MGLLFKEMRNLISKIAINLARSQIASDARDVIVTEFSIGTMKFSCLFVVQILKGEEHYLASTKPYLKFPFCCGHEMVVLPSVATPPDLLLHLHTATDSRGRAFRDHIRSYNSALAFATLGANLEKELENAKRGVYTHTHTHTHTRFTELYTTLLVSCCLEKERNSARSNLYP